MNKKKYLLQFIAILGMLFTITSSLVASTECTIVYDAGSSGTRLYVYEKNENNWIVHEGPKGSALADPVREIRGKTWADVDSVVSEVVYMLELMKIDGPEQKSGKVKWSAFDWSKNCNVTSASVYATAGMRIAEQEEKDKSRELWSKLKQKLSNKLGKSVKINARTLTGFEEGFYAWLAVKQTSKTNQFGIIEMGGASSQITFPCNECKESKKVIVNGEILPIYSYSFLGLGQDEAPKSLGFNPSCGYGVALKFPKWEVNECANKIEIKTTKGIKDPYNIGVNSPGRYNDIPLNKANIQKWTLTGAFNYMSESDIPNCCEKEGTKEECYGGENSCYQAVYLEKYLNVLGVKNTQKADVSWTYGATICMAEDCLKNAGKLPCRWLEDGCLY